MRSPRSQFVARIGCGYKNITASLSHGAYVVCVLHRAAVLAPRSVDNYRKGTGVIVGYSNADSLDSLQVDRRPCALGIRRNDPFSSSGWEAR